MAFKLALLVFITSAATAFGVVYDCYPAGVGGAKDLCGGFINDFCKVASTTSGLGKGDTIRRCASASNTVVCDLKVTNSGPIASTTVSETECTSVLNQIVNNCDKGGNGRYSSADPVDPVLFTIDPNAGSSC